MLSGEIIIYRAEDGNVHGEQLLTVHRTGHFTGELDHVSARALLVTARATVAALVIRVEAADVRRLMAGEPDIAEIVIRAFMLRRMGALHHGDTAITLLGPAGSVDTLRIERFVIRNGYPLNLADTATDPLAIDRMVELGLELGDLAAVITVDRCILRKRQASRRR